MSTAYKCQLTGKLNEGKGVINFLVDLSKTCCLLVIPQARISAQKTEQSEISPEAVEKIRKALAAIADPEEKPAAK